MIRLGAQTGVDPVGTADDKGDITAPRIPPASEAIREPGRGFDAPPLVQTADHRPPGHRAAQQVGLARHAAALAVLDLCNGQRAKAQRPARSVKAGGII